MPPMPRPARVETKAGSSSACFVKASATRNSSEEKSPSARVSTAGTRAAGSIGPIRLARAGTASGRASSSRRSITNPPSLPASARRPCAFGSSRGHAPGSTALYFASPSPPRERWIQQGPASPSSMVRVHESASMSSVSIAVSGSPGEIMTSW